MFPDVAMLKVVQITPPQELLVKIDQAVAELRGLQRKVHTIQTAAQTAVGALIAALTESKMAQVEAALLFALGMDRTAHWVAAASAATGGWLAILEEH